MLKYNIIVIDDVSTSLNVELFPAYTYIFLFIAFLKSTQDT
jgi:hypothetical protein